MNNHKLYEYIFISKIMKLIYFLFLLSFFGSGIDAYEYHFNHTRINVNDSIIMISIHVTWIYGWIVLEEI